MRLLENTYIRTQVLPRNPDACPCRLLVLPTPGTAYDTGKYSRSLTGVVVGSHLLRGPDHLSGIISYKGESSTHVAELATIRRNNVTT